MEDEKKCEVNHLKKFNFKCFIDYFKPKTSVV